MTINGIKANSLIDYYYKLISNGCPIRLDDITPEIIGEMTPNQACQVFLSRKWLTSNKV